MSASLERAIVDCIEHEKPLRHFLYPLSLLFKWGVSLRHQAYDRKWLSQVKVPGKVVSIGNLVAGGTGKTPLLMLLLKRVEKGAVLTRGYRTFDEPQMLLNHFPHLTLHIGKDRVKAARKVEGLIFLDDGMQHRALHRDIEIVVLKGSDLFGKGYFLPRGFLRDSPERLQEADYIVVNHLEDEADFASKLKVIREYSEAPVIGTKMVLEKSYEGQKVGVFCGLGSPQMFIKSVEQAGGEIVDTFLLPDHVSPTKEALEAFRLSCQSKGAEKLLCTEKDWVKLAFRDHVECAYGEMEVVYGKNEFEALIRDILRETLG